MKKQINYLRTIRSLLGVVTSIALPLVGSAQSSGVQQSTTAPAHNGFNGMSDETRAKMNAMVKPSNDLEDEARALYQAGDIKGSERVCAESIRRSARAEGKVWNTTAMQLMGEILIRQGKNREAIPYLKESFNFGGAGVVAHLDLSIAYCRLKEYRNALKHYSDRAILTHIEDAFPRSAENLPGTRSLVSLEASALLARGIEDYFSRGSDWTLPYLSEAERLVPHNPLIEGFIDKCFLDHRLSVETIKQYARSTTSKRSYLAAAARRRIATIEAWHKLKATEAKQNDAPPDAGR